MVTFNSTQRQRQNAMMAQQPNVHPGRFMQPGMPGAPIAPPAAPGVHKGSAPRLLPPTPGAGGVPGGVVGAIPGANKPTGPGDVDLETQQLVSKYLDPSAQNAADTKRLTDEMKATVGANLVNARAAGGRSGLGVGAQQALEGDVNMKAQMQLADQIAAAQQQNFQNAIGAGNLDIGERQAANQQAALEAQLDYLKSVLAGQPSTNTPPPQDPAAVLGGQSGSSNQTIGQQAVGPTASSTLAASSDKNAPYVVDPKTHQLVRAVKDASGKWVAPS